MIDYILSNERYIGDALLQKKFTTDTKLLQTLKTFITMTVKCDDSEDRELEIKVRLAEINDEFQKAMSLVSVDDDNNLVIEQRLTELIMEKEKLDNPGYV